MSEARDQILARIRGALADVPATEAAGDVAVARDYRRAGGLEPVGRVALLIDRLLDYHAEVRRVAPDAVADAVDRACAQWGLARVAVPPSLPPEWRPTGADVVEDDGLTPAQLDTIDGAVTGCATAIAQTGTLVLDGEGTCGRRVLTLVPDHHICIVATDQIVELVPEAIAELAPGVRERRTPVTFVSGPSASSDIELSRVEGVHGPRHLLVLIVAG
jgi:L-lactate dehydrogenase complex protein LldG